MKDNNKDLIMIDGLFFLRPQAIKQNTVIAKEALKGIFEYISYN